MDGSAPHSVRAMKTVHIPTLPEIERRSPRGTFRSFCKNISGALGARLWLGEPGEVHPFDVQQRRIPAGAAICPFHVHASQWEMFVVLSGRGTVRVNDERHDIGPGDVFIHAPGTAHQTINTGGDELVVMIVGDNPPSDICYYPDSDKWGLSPHRAWFRVTPADYCEGEEAGALPAPPPVPTRPAALGAPRPFRKVNLAALPWENFDSPRKMFRGRSKELSIALGAVRNTGVHAGGHPFDLEYGVLPPGFAGCPFHSHAAQWECFVIVSGRGSVRTTDGVHAVGAGDAFLHAPGTAHQLKNSGAEDLVYFLVADNPPADYFHYPDSNKWGLRAPRKFFRATEVDYWDGEE